MNSILYVDDEANNLETFRRAFGSDFAVTTCQSGLEALGTLQQGEFALLVADQRMPGMSGIELCERAIQVSPQTIRIILTAFTETELLLAAIHRGQVQDYLVKPWKKSEIKPILEKAFEIYQERVKKIQELERRCGEVQHLRKEIHSTYNFEGLIGASSGLRGVLETIQKAAASNSNVLLSGESGTGKELMARAIHVLSRRKEGPFLPLHCAAVPETLFESELFGHERGAFTGADRVHLGLFEVASGGTVFLDEVGEIPLSVQSKLLRVLQEREIQRLGGHRTIPIDIRLVAATNKDLAIEVREKRFREDLYYRLDVIEVILPPLRERKEDIPALARHFLEKSNRHTVGKTLILSEPAIDLLKQYDWPGNVRELENIIERAAILAPGSTIEPEDLNLNLDEMLKTDRVDLAGMAAQASGSYRHEIQQKEMERLAEALGKAGGNIAEAARILEIPRSTLFHRLKKHGLL